MHFEKFMHFDKYFISFSADTCACYKSFHYALSQYLEFNFPSHIWWVYFQQKFAENKPSS